MIPRDEAAELWTSPGGGSGRLLVGSDQLDHIEFWDWRSSQGTAHRRSAPGGTMEILHVLDGDLVLEVDGESHAAAAGESILFSADADHCYGNKGARSLRVFMIVLTPPAAGRSRRGAIPAIRRCAMTAADRDWLTDDFPELRDAPPWVMEEMIVRQPQVAAPILGDDSPEVRRLREACQGSRRRRARRRHRLRHLGARRIGRGRAAHRNRFAVRASLRLGRRRARPSTPPSTRAPAACASPSRMTAGPGRPGWR